MTYGATGVTATYTPTGPYPCDSIDQLSRDQIIGLGNGAFAFSSPIPPADARYMDFIWTGACTPGRSNTGDVVFNKPLIGARIDVVNIESSTATITGASTAGAPLGLSLINSNPQLELTGNTLNSTPGPVTAFGCTGAGSAPPASAGCGTVRISASSGLVRTARLENLNPPPLAGADAWFWAFTFPTAPLTAAFASPTITAGQTTGLTFTIANPSDPGSEALSPLGFTTTLPAGLSIADGTATTNGACGSPAIRDAAGDALAAGAGGLRVTGIGVGVGATCTITVNVTSATPGTRTLSAAATETHVGNLVSTSGGTLTVLPAAAPPAPPPLPAAPGTGALRVTVGANKDAVSPGRLVLFRVRVRNISRVDVLNVRVCDRIPSGLRFVSTNPDSRSSAGRRCWQVGTLAAGTQRTLRLVARARSGARGKRTNVVTATGTGVTSQTARATVQLLGGRARPIIG